jgi:hypothetical protein
MLIQEVIAGTGMPMKGEQKSYELVFLHYLC